MNTKNLILMIALLIVAAVLPAACAGRPSAVPGPGPWTGVPGYTDSTNTITARVNQTFSIMLPPAPLFGWGWQNNNSTAFALLETKTLPGSGNETNPYGPNAFLFQALKTGTYQITLYVASKPPQQTESFNIIVKP